MDVGRHPLFNSSVRPQSSAERRPLLVLVLVLVPVLVPALVLVLVIMLHWLRRPKHYQQAAPFLAVRTLTQAVCSPRRQGATPRVSATGGHLAECGLPEVSRPECNERRAIKRKIIAHSSVSDEGTLIASKCMQRSRKGRMQNHATKYSNMQSQLELFKLSSSQP